MGHKQNDCFDDDVEDEEESDETVSSEADDEDVMEWNSFSEKLKNHRGIAWNLIKHYGSNLIEKYKLLKMEECLRKMVRWDPRNRITPELVLKEYFPKNKSNENVTKYSQSTHEKDDDDD